MWCVLGGLALLGGCAAPHAPDASTSGEAAASGTVMHWRTYENRYFGFRIRVPRDWHSADNAFMQAYTYGGVNVLSGNRDDLALMIAQHDPRAILLVTAMRYPVGSLSEGFNDNIACAAIKVSDVADVVNGADYLRMATGGGRARVSKIRSLSIGGRAFYIRAVTRPDKPGVVQQVAATVHKGYAFTCTLTYASDSKAQVLYRSLDSIRITP